MFKRNFKYTYIHYKDKTGADVVIALSTYEGKTVKGVARCHPTDEFDLEKGKAIAAARCNEAVSIKRAKRAARKVDEARMQVADAVRHLNNMQLYLADAETALSQAVLDKTTLLANS
jgi:hypothetical protein